MESLSFLIFFWCLAQGLSTLGIRWRYVDQVIKFYPQATLEPHKSLPSQICHSEYMKKGKDNAPLCALP